MAYMYSRKALNDLAKAEADDIRRASKHPACVASWHLVLPSLGEPNQAALRVTINALAFEAPVVRHVAI